MGGKCVGATQVSANLAATLSLGSARRLVSRQVYCCSLFPAISGEDTQLSRPQGLCVGGTGAASCGLLHTPLINHLCDPMKAVTVGLDASVAGKITGLWREEAELPGTVLVNLSRGLSSPRPGCPCFT